MKRVLLVRHGEAEGTAPKVLLGRSDPSLSETGRKQVASLRPLLPLNAAVVCLSSSLTRARQTAEIVIGGRSFPLEIDPDLREIDFGEWEGLNFDEIKRSYPEHADLWFRFSEDFAFPGGESLLEFGARIERLGKRLAAIDTETVVVFTHGGVIRALICHFLGLGLRDYLLFDVGLATVTTIHLWDGRGVLAGLSQTPADRETSEA